MQSVSEHRGVKLPYDIIKVIKQNAKESLGIDLTEEMIHNVEKETDITLFDGGAFVAVGNMFDLFVVPERRGKWRIRSVVTNYLTQMLNKYGELYVNVYEHNKPSLRLIEFFGFEHIGSNRDQGGVFRIYRLRNE